MLVPCFAYFSTLKMEATCSSETSVGFQRATRSYSEPGYRSRYSDWLRVGRPRGRSSSPGGVKNFLFSTLSRSALGPTRPPIQWLPAGFSPGVKRPGRESGHSPPGGAEIKEIRIYTSTTPIRFHGVVFN
jgi:hypothetical protein